MSKRPVDSTMELQYDLERRVKPLVELAPWVLRITEFKDKQGPVLVIRQRHLPDHQVKQGDASPARTMLRDRGLLHGQPLRRCLPVIRGMLNRVCDQADIPMDLHRFVGTDRIEFRGNLPLNNEVGAKLALLFKLQERINEMDRVELIAWRVERFSREEAEYWLTRTMQYGDAASRWALAGMRIMLGGQPGDKQIQTMLDKLRK